MISNIYAATLSFAAIFGELLGNKRPRTGAADRGHRRQFRRPGGGHKVGDLAGRPLRSIVHLGTARGFSHSSWVSGLSDTM